jgi:predicted site-specific integrase-resolvase
MLCRKFFVGVGMTEEIAEYLPVAEAAKKTGISENLVRKWARNGQVTTMNTQYGVRVNMPSLWHRKRHSYRKAVYADS